jgi:hypothetical protein
MAFALKLSYLLSYMLNCVHNQPHACAYVRPMSLVICTLLHHKSQNIGIDQLLAVDMLLSCIHLKYILSQ